MTYTRRGEALSWLKTIVQEETDDCIIWPFGANRKNGRGVTTLNGKRMLATHAVLILSGQPRPDGLHALHSCDTPACVNPRHLRWGTRSENVQDAFQRGQIGNIQRRHEVRTLFLKGSSIYDLAQHFKMSYGGIYAYVKDLPQQPKRWEGKLTFDQIEDIRSRYVRGNRWNKGNSDVLAKEFGVSQVTINNIGSGRTHKPK